MDSKPSSLESLNQQAVSEVRNIKHKAISATQLFQKATPRPAIASLFVVGFYSCGPEREFPFLSLRRISESGGEVCVALIFSMGLPLSGLLQHHPLPHRCGVTRKTDK
uniref:Uncharacterized protein n=1 Tax=Physcomitrium patens TaxID=3218 RepID=A0A2K1L414_PHYPA|nr:hypothetical protein PHYPA_003560 [Physcomitrium patens]